MYKQPGKLNDPNKKKPATKEKPPLTRMEYAAQEAKRGSQGSASTYFGSKRKTGGRDTDILGGAVAGVKAFISGPPKARKKGTAGS